MNEGFPTEPTVPSAEQQIAEQGMITQAPGQAEAPAGAAAPFGVLPEGTPATPIVEHGGYATGVRVGEMGNNIARLQAQGKWAEANALTAELNKVSPGIPVDK